MLGKTGNVMRMLLFSLSRQAKLVYGESGKDTRMLSIHLFFCDLCRLAQKFLSGW